MLIPEGRNKRSKSRDRLRKAKWRYSPPLDIIADLSSLLGRMELNREYLVVPDDCFALYIWMDEIVPDAALHAFGLLGEPE